MKTKLIVSLWFAVGTMMVSGLTAVADTQTDVDWFSVTDITKGDGTRGFLYQDQKLFVGKVGDSEYGHRIEIFSNDGKTLLDRVIFPHSVTHIYPRTATSVLVTGKAYTDQWYTYYTMMSWNGSDYNLRTTRISPEVQINEFGEVNGSFYFTEPGSRSVFRGRGSRMAALPFEISFPSQIVASSGSMWLLEKRGPGPGDESLVHIDLSRSEITRVEGIQGQYGPYNLRVIGEDLLLMDDRLGNRIAVYDTNKMDIRYNVELPHTPMNVEPVGSCAIVPTGDAKHLYVVKLDDDAGEILETIDLGGIPGAFTNVVEAEINRENGVMFVRSVNPCIFCEKSQSGVYGIQTQMDWSLCD